MGEAELSHVCEADVWDVFVKGKCDFYNVKKYFNEDDFDYKQFHVLMIPINNREKKIVSLIALYPKQHGIRIFASTVGGSPSGDEATVPSGKAALEFNKALYSFALVKVAPKDNEWTVIKPIPSEETPKLLNAGQQSVCEQLYIQTCMRHLQDNTTCDEWQLVGCNAVSAAQCAVSAYLAAMEPVEPMCCGDVTAMEPVEAICSGDVAAMEPVEAICSGDVAAMEPVEAICSGDVAAMEPVEAICSGDVAAMEPALKRSDKLNICGSRTTSTVIKYQVGDGDKKRVLCHLTKAHYALEESYHAAVALSKSNDNTLDVFGCDVVLSTPRLTKTSLVIVLNQVKEGAWTVMKIHEQKGEVNHFCCNEYGTNNWSDVTLDWMSYGKDNLSPMRWVLMRSSLIKKKNPKVEKKPKKPPRQVRQRTDTNQFVLAASSAKSIALKLSNAAHAAISYHAAVALAKSTDNTLDVFGCDVVPSTPRLTRTSLVIVLNQVKEGAWTVMKIHEQKGEVNHFCCNEYGTNNCSDVTLDWMSYGKDNLSPMRWVLMRSSLIKKLHSL